MLDGRIIEHRFDTAVESIEQGWKMCEAHRGAESVSDCICIYVCHYVICVNFLGSLAAQDPSVIVYVCVCMSLCHLCGIHCSAESVSDCICVFVCHYAICVNFLAAQDVYVCMHAV